MKEWLLAIRDALFSKSEGVKELRKFGLLDW